LQIRPICSARQYNENADKKDVPLVLLAGKDIAPNDVGSDLITAEDGGKQQILINVKQRLINKNVQFHDVLRKHRSKTFADMYKTATFAQQSAQKIIKTDSMLMQPLPNAVTAGRSMEFE